MMRLKIAKGLNKQDLQFKIIRHKKVLNQIIKKNFNYFYSVFNIIQYDSQTIKRLRKGVILKKIVRFERKIAPNKSLRINALILRVMKHGMYARARILIENLIILLTEMSKEHSGIAAINRVLLRLEPPFDIVLKKSKKGRKKRSIRVKITYAWPSRRKFLAVKFLVAGANKRRKIKRCSFLLALYQEILENLIITNSINSYAVRFKDKFLAFGIKHSEFMLDNKLILK